MTHEEWRDVVGYEGYYQVSNLGNVRSVDRSIVCKNGTVKHIRGRVMQQTFNKKNGYFAVTLNKNGRRKLFTTHRLVATAFVPNTEAFECVDHINNIKTDNRAENLRWCTVKQNTNYAKEFVDLASWVRRPVLRSDGAVFKSVTDAAKSINRSRASIQDVLRGKRKTCNGYSFSYC